MTHRSHLIAWAMVALLAGSVLVGMAIEPPKEQEARKDTAEAGNQLPRFECDDRSVPLYERDEDAKKLHLDWMRENLRVDSGQLEALGAIFDNATFRADEFWRDARDSYCDLRDEMRANVRAELTEEQEQRLDELIAQYRADRRAESDAKKTE